MIPIVRFLHPDPAWFQTAEDRFLTVSRVLTGSDALSADVAERIQKLLTDWVERLESKLAGLASAMQEAGDSRVTQLCGLSDD
jgi:DNA recombination-dependent growth factor C